MDNNLDTMDINDLSRKIAEARIKTYGDKLNLEGVSEALKEYLEDRRRDEFIDGCIERWNELWPQPFWAKRIDNKNNNNEKDKK